MTAKTAPRGPEATTTRRRSSDGVDLRAECDRLAADNARLRGERDRLAADTEKLTAKVERLQARLKKLQATLEEARRATKRQAAPFSRGKPQDPRKRKRPGRKPGKDYGRRARRMPPEVPDEDRQAPLPDACPHCGAEVVLDRWTEQFQDELVAAVVRRRYWVALGRCSSCTRPVHGRHPDQTSDALGAAGVSLGPKALALAAWLRHGAGMPAAKIARLFAELGLSVTAGGITSAIGRLGADGEGAYAALLQALRASPVVSPDETGWRVDGKRGWLWAYVGDHVTVYDIAVGRGYDEAKAILGEDYDGVICRDGWAPYRRFTQAEHQSCFAHLIRRCSEMIADSAAGQARIPHALRRLLGDALDLRDAREAGQVQGAELEGAIEDLQRRLDKLLASRPTHEPNRRLLAHLGNERDALLTFLRYEGVPATNHEAERAIRPQVCARKNWGGNKSWQGARSAAVLGSILRSADQQGADPLEVLARIATTDGASSGLPLLARGPDP
jgi:transposase